RTIDRRCLPAHRLHDDPARHAWLFRPGPGARKSRLGHCNQGCEPAAALLHPPGAAADDRADVVRAGAEPFGGLAARTVYEGLMAGPLALLGKQGLERPMNEAVRDPSQPIIEIENLSISFFTRKGEIPAVMDFSCTVMPGEAMGIVGESGCGKSTVSLGIMRDLSNIGKIVGGRIKFQGKDMGEMSEEELRAIRGNKIAMIYQEPMASLNPAMKIGQQLMEVPLIHNKVSKDEAHKRALDMVRAVRLPDPERMMRSYPHQLSGGQQQRIVIAMALLSKPALLLLDEPTTALDVTVEAGIVELVKGLGEKFGTSMIFVSHNLGLILESCDRITLVDSGGAVKT